MTLFLFISAIIQSATTSGGYEELSDEEVCFDGDFDAQEVSGA